MAGTIGLARGWWVVVLRGVAAIVFGVLAFVAPMFGIALLVALFAIWALVDGIGNLLTGIRTRGRDRSWWIEIAEGIAGEVWMALAGVASILFGVVIFLFPAAGALSIVWLIGSFAIAFGAFLVLLGWRLRGVDQLARRDAAHDYGV